MKNPLYFGFNSLFKIVSHINKLNWNSYELQLSVDILIFYFYYYFLVTPIDSRSSIVANQNKHDLIGCIKF